MAWACCALLPVFSRALGDAPVGWSVSAPAFDVWLERLSDTQLIDRLQSLDMSRLNLPGKWKPGTGFVYLDSFVELSAPDSSIRIWSPELRELVRRGVAAVPALLTHLDDARPTRLAFRVPHGRPPETRRMVHLADEYDNRAAPLAGIAVNTHAAVPTAVEGGYVVKLGDLCYVALGQIVHRRLFIFSYTNSGFDEHGRYKCPMVMNGAPFGFSFVDSPVATPALTGAARSDWQRLNAQAHADSLRADVDSKRDSSGALCRLMAYYPLEGRSEIHAGLQRTLSQRGEVVFWPNQAILSPLAFFWWDDLSGDLSAVAKMAIRQDRRWESLDDTRRNPLATGTADALAACADLLVHHGDDVRLRSMVTEEIRRLRQQAAEHGGGGAGLAYKYHVDRFEAILARLDGHRETEGGPPRELPAAPAPAQITAALDGIQPAFGRWPMLRLRFRVRGTSTQQLAAARVCITTARDDTGFDLAPGSIPSFVHPAVGRTNDVVMTRNEPPSLDVLLGAPPGTAKRLVLLKGYVDLVVPEYDDAATVKIGRVAATAGTPLRLPALAAAGVAVTVKAGSNALAGAPADIIPAAYPVLQGPSLSDSDISLSIDDPGGRVVATEFVAADGSPLRYNHNGWYHASQADGRRVDVYRLAPEDISSATLVLHLAIGKALVRLPFEFNEVALPAD